MNPLVLSALATAVPLLSSRAQAQTPPTSAEVAACWGPHATAAHGDTAELIRLIQSGADLNARDSNSRTPLHEAVILGDGGPRHIETVRALVEAGANATPPTGRA
jgi:ankyrin repeat protein